MSINSTADKLRKALPGFIWEPFRKVSNSILGPLCFSWETGHLKSSLKSRAVDKKGQPLPWYTYPAIEWILGKDWKGANVLEFGCGQSSLFWDRMGATVTGIEDNLTWKLMLEYQLRKAKHKIIYQDPKDSLLGNEYLNSLGYGSSNYPFDVICVDGCDRYAAAFWAYSFMCNNTFVIIDNSGGNHKSAAKPERGYIEMFNENPDIIRIDFIGYPPGNSRAHCTSVFFYPQNKRLKNQPVPVVSLV